VARTLVLLLIYPLIFYLEKMIELAKKLKDYIIIGLEFLVELTQKIKVAAYG